jgi:SUKH-4 immunity protein
MIEPSTFVERWREVQMNLEAPEEEKLCTASELSQCRLPEDAKRFLKEAGLPADCSPFLSFEQVERLPRLWDIFSPGKWEQKQKDRVSQYIMIGSDDAGNAICLDESTDGRVVIVDHETLFEKTGFWSRNKLPAIHPMNRSVLQLAESLLCQALFMQKITQLGYSAISDSMPEEPVNWLADELKRIDETVLLKDSFWHNEIRHNLQLAKNSA